jgi:glycosyltransferase involved in cell wall biosynthesis
MVVGIAKIPPGTRVPRETSGRATGRGGARDARGAGPGLAVVGDGPAREDLEASAPSFVRFLGELRGDDLADVYASADIFCFPTTTDTFGQVLLEAGASGLPVVAAATGGAPDLVEAETSGLLVPPDDAPALAAALVRLAHDDELRARLGQGGRAAAERRTWTRWFAELRATYRLVSAEARARSARTLAA